MTSMSFNLVPALFLRLIRLRWALLWLLLILVILMVCYQLIVLANSSIQTVKIVGNDQVLAEKTLVERLMPMVKRPFFDVNVYQTQSSLLHLPGVKYAAVQRVWPHTVIISLVAKKILGQWQNHALLAQDGTIIALDANKSRKIPGLIRFVAPSDSAAKVIKTYRQIQPLLQKLPWTVKQINLSPNLQWSIQFNNNTILKLGQYDLTERLQRFVNLMPKLFVDGDRRADSIDMRYAMGVAVKWH